MNKEKNKSSAVAELNQNNNIIIAGKTYRVKELDCIFSIPALMNATKEELYNYWQMAIETEIKRYRDIVDYVFNKRFPRYE